MNNIELNGEQCQVSLIEDSIIEGRESSRLTTLSLKYPRFIHAEFLTHRMFSRNASSTRAIPTVKLIKEVRDNPAFFVKLGKNQPGMQAGEEVEEYLREKFAQEWKHLAELVCNAAQRWSEDYGLHKQIAGRVLEPFSYISVVVTATEWDNFLTLRTHSDAQPEIQDLAVTIKRVLQGSQPTVRKVNKNHEWNRDYWHLPYITPEERNSTDNTLGELLGMSAARCARVSYLTHDKQQPNKEQDLKLYDRLCGSEPIHASPLEHQAFTSPKDGFIKNFNGWVQHRYLWEHGVKIHLKN